MLASMASPSYSPPLREQSHLDIQQSSSSSSLADPLNIEDRLCPGCKKSAVSDQGGLVVAFGQSFFHVDCFRCAKCGNQVTADTNLLLLSDGSPICADCSYNCNVCHLPILDEAIMTGDDSYHAHCFKCKVCKERIDELVFAKTSQGIYCMKCHNKRMIKIRNYTQKKAERERNGGSGSSKSRDREARNYHQDSGSSATGHESLSRPSSSRSNGNLSAILQQDTSHPSIERNAEGSAYARPTIKPKGPLQPYNAQESKSSLPQSQAHPNGTSATMHLHSPSLSPSVSSQPAVTIAPPSEIERPAPSKSSTLPVHLTNGNVDLDGRRRSYDDGVRPLNILFGQKSASANSTLRPGTPPTKSEGLTVTTRQEKRRSINPGLALPNFSAALPSGGTVNASLSPQSAASSNRWATRSPTPPPPAGRESPFPVLRPPESDQPGQVSRPTSQSSSIHSYNTFRTATDREMERSRSPSVNDNPDNEDRTIVLKSSRSRSRESASRSQSPIVQATSSQDDGHSHSQINGNRLSATSVHDVDEQNSAASSRSNSPYYQVDVPRGIEDGSDSDAAGEAASPMYDQRYSLPPVPPPKNGEEHLDHLQPSTLGDDPDVSTLSQQDILDDISESSPVERTSRATFIAPALPPIRFSLGAGDFSELLNSVQGTQALKSIATLLEEPENPIIPPSKASSEATLTTVPPALTATKELVSKRSRQAPSPPELDGYKDKIQPQTAKRPSTDDKPLPVVDQLSVVEPASPLTKSKPLTDSLNAIRISLADPHPARTTTPKHDMVDMVTARLREALDASQGRGTPQIYLDVELVEAILATLDSNKAAYNTIKDKLDGMKRTSKHFIDGLTVAQVEYDKELKARRDAEAEVTRLRVLLSGQAAKLTALSGDDRRQEVRQQLSKELNDSLSGLENHLSQLKLERDMTLAEMEELSSTKSATSPEKPTGNLGRSLTKRLDSLKKQYQRELIPLTQHRETLSREIAELKAIRDMFLEETTALNARNEELAQLSHLYSRRLEAIPETPLKQGQTASMPIPRGSFDKSRNGGHAQASSIAPSLSASTSGSSTIHEDHDRYMRLPKQDMEMHTPRKFKWMGSRPKDVASPAMSHLQENTRGKGQMEHNFQQVSALLITRCDQCGEKLWGSQLRCTGCSASIHVRCLSNVQIPCATRRREELQGPLPPSLFGRDLTEQAQADSRGSDRQVPVIVEKCIAAVEITALDYEGIYRKTGGSSQSKIITQLFERGDYEAFDLLDTDRFNDICSVTSVLKTYFRSLPNPLLTFELYDQFVKGITIKDLVVKNRTLSDIIAQLPSEHYYTLRLLMLHLNHIHERNEKNLMTARNLGVVFGPTLIRSREPSAEFDDMAQRALLVEWLIENAPQVFNGV